MNIILCGMPMSGKSHFAKLTAEQFGLVYMDTDFLIEQFYRMMFTSEVKCGEIYKKHGADYFRMLERSAVNSLTTCQNCIIAIGGGSLLDPENVKVLKSVGPIIYLKADINVLLERLEKRENKPTYLNDKDFQASYQKVADERTKIYESLCDLTIDTSKLNEDQVVAQIGRFKDANK